MPKHCLSCRDNLWKGSFFFLTHVCHYLLLFFSIEFGLPRMTRQLQKLIAYNTIPSTRMVNRQDIAGILEWSIFKGAVEPRHPNPPWTEGASNPTRNFAKLRIPGHWTKASLTMWRWCILTHKYWRSSNWSYQPTHGWQWKARDSQPNQTGGDRSHSILSTEQKLTYMRPAEFNWIWWVDTAQMGPF
jgi:hypothetical protein